MDESDDYKVKRKTLLAKYEIPIQYLDFEYVKTCTDAKTLEKVVIILRSGEEGYFPDLTRCAEEKLRELMPNSKLFRVEVALISKDALEEEERIQVDDEISSFISNMRIQNDLLKEVKSDTRQIPPIRKSKPEKVECKEMALPNNDLDNRIKSYEYDKWDKYDADSEVLKVDLDEERTREAVAIKNKKNLQKTLIEVIEDKEVEALSSVEREQLAFRYKDKGNECFKAKELEEALQDYTKSIRIKPMAATFNNRALIYLKMKQFGNALIDCNSCLSMEPNNQKAMLRKAQALVSLDQHNEAYDLYEKILDTDPLNPTALQEFSKLPPRNAFRMQIEEVNSITEIPTQARKISKSTEKLEIAEFIPAAVKNIVEPEKSIFDPLTKNIKQEPERQTLLMPSDVPNKRSKKLLIEEIN